MKTLSRTQKLMIATGVTLIMGALVAPSAFAEETAGEKVESKGRDAKTAAKKGGRRVKKAVRDATGNSSTTEDAKDSLRNAGDKTSDAIKDAKNKID